MLLFLTLTISSGYYPNKLDKRQLLCSLVVNAIETDVETNNKMIKE